MPAWPETLLACVTLALVAWLLLRPRRGPLPRAEEARPLLEAELDGWRARAYGELEGCLGRPSTSTVEGPRGIAYRIQVQVFWDDHPGGTLRVRGTVDDGGVRAFMPLCEDFLMQVDGSLRESA